MVPACLLHNQAQGLESNMEWHFFLLWSSHVCNILSQKYSTVANDFFFAN